MSNGLFFALALSLSDEQFRSWGWRIPFLVSAVLVALGLYVRLKITETPAFQAALDRNERVRVPVATLITQHWRPTLLGALAMVVCYAVLHLDGVLAVLRRVGAAYSAPEFPRPAVFRGRVHGTRDAAVRVGIGPLRPQAGARRGRDRRAAVGFCDGAAARWRLDAARRTVPDDRAVPDGRDVRADGRCCRSCSRPTSATGAGVAYNLGGILGASIAPYIAQLLARTAGCRGSAVMYRLRRQSA